MADLRISDLPALTGAFLQATDPIAIADLSASETKKITAKDLVQAGVALIDAGSIPSDKLDATPPPGSIGTTQLADNSVTAAKLADQSSGVFQAGLPAAGAFVGQLAVNSTDNKAYIWDGSSWSLFRASLSVNKLTYDNTTGPLELSGIAVGDSVELSALPKDTTAAGLFMAGPASIGGTVNYRAIVGSDLPASTATTKGAVQVSGDGLRMDVDRIEIDNDVIPPTAGLYYIVSYDAKGLVTDGKEIEADDLPVATTTTPGIVFPGSDLTVQATGQIDHQEKVPGGGSFPKITFNSTGHVLSGSALDVADIPDLPASKITSGTFDSTRIADGSINAFQLADYAIAYIQEAEPTAVDPGSIGMLWLKESTASLRMWNGNSWYSVGLGRVIQENLRWGGLIDADTGLITGVTKLGLQGGLQVNLPLPDAKDQLGGLYVVVTVAGTNIGQTPGVSYDAGDYCLCIDQTNGWERVDISAGGGGGPGASFLNDLLDVTIASPLNGQLLSFNSGIGQWVNINYTLGLLGDVDLTTTPPVTDDLLRYDGTDWLPVTALSLGTALATPSTLMARDANGDTAVNKITAAIFDIDALPALP